MGLQLDFLAQGRWIGSQLELASSKSMFGKQVSWSAVGLIIMFLPFSSPDDIQCARFHDEFPFLKHGNI
jgi:hypothetical protein